MIRSSVTWLAFLLLCGLAWACSGASAQRSEDPPKASDEGPSVGIDEGSEQTADDAQPAVEASEEELVMAIDGAFIEVEGLRLQELHCEGVDGWAVLSWVIALSEGKAALDACVATGAAFRLDFGGGGRPALLSSSAPTEAACVLDALERSQVAPPGECRATLLLGDGELASQAAEALPR